MSTHVEIDFLPEILLELHLTPEELAQLLKEKSAMALFREGRISSGLAARWTGLPRAQFLLHAMREGAVIGTDSADEVRRESALL
jgi:predicted HTH domain antitoxin